MARPLSLLEERRDQSSRPSGATALDGFVVDGGTEPSPHQFGESGGGRLLVRGRLRPAVAAQPMDDVVVLLELVAKRDVDEGPMVGDEALRA